jgi:predicted MPP superfamily phosphohydrolase
VLVEREAFVTDLDPRHDGLRIAHLTDIHVGRITPRRHIREAVELANRAGADLIALTGDYVCWKLSEIAMMEEQLAGLEAPRVVATLGNHDYFTSASRISAALRRNGYDVLFNEHTTVEVRGAPLHVVGIDDPVTRKDDVPAAFHGLSGRAGTRVALAHCPEASHAIAGHGADLILSGHTHGGQIWVKGLSDRIFYKRMRRRYRVGMYRVDDSELYVGAGVGFSGVRARFGNGTRAEVALITLRVRPQAG